MADGTSNTGGSVEQQFARLRALLQDWDSYGAPPIDLVVLERARAWLAAVQVVPMSGGGVQLEWHADGVDVEIAFDIDGTVWARAETPNGRLDDAYGMALEVLCRVFDDGADVAMDEWLAWYQPGQWFTMSRALGAFIRQRLHGAHQALEEHLSPAERSARMATVQRTGQDLRSCGHPGLVEGCLSCAAEEGRRIGHTEAGAYATAEEVRAR